MPPTPETCSKARSSQLSSRKKGVQETLTGPQSTGKVRKCSLRLRKLASSKTKEPGTFPEVLKCRTEQVTNVTNDRASQVSTHGKFKFSTVDLRQRTLRNSLQLGSSSNREKPDRSLEKHTIRNGQVKSSSAGTSLEENLANSHKEPKKVPKPCTKRLLSMRVALADVELGSTEDNGLFKTAEKRKTDPSSAPVNAPQKRDTNVKGAFPYTGVGRPSKYDIPTVSPASRVEDSSVAKDKGANQTDGMEVQTCKIAKLRGNGSAIEWIQVDLTEASINDYIKSKKAKLAEDEKMHNGGARKKEKTYYVTANIVENSARQECNKKTVLKNSCKASSSLSKLRVVDYVGNSKNRNKQSGITVVEKEATPQTVVLTPKNMFSCIHAGCAFSTDYESRLKKHLRSHDSATANAIGCLQDNSKEQAPYQKNIVSDDIDTTAECIILDEVQSKSSNCENHKVFHEKEQEQTSVREAHNNETFPEIKGKHQSVDGVEGLLGIHQQRDSKNEKHTETVVPVTEQDGVNTDVKQVPLQNSGEENHSETVLQDIEQHEVKDKVKVVTVTHEPEGSGEDTGIETAFEVLQQHQLAVQKEATSIVSQEEVTVTETPSEAAEQSRQQQQVTLEEDDTAVINQQETSSKETHSEAIILVNQQQHVTLHDGSPAEVNQQETTGKDTHSQVRHQQQQAILEEDSTAIVNQQETTGKETHSDEVEHVRQQHTTLEEVDIAVINQEETSGTETKSETVVWQQQQVTLEKDDMTVNDQEESTGKETDSEVVKQVRQQEQVTLEEVDTAVINQQETTGKETCSEATVQDRQQEQVHVTLQEDDNDVINQQETNNEEAHLEAVVQVRQQEQVTLEEDDMTVNYQEKTTRTESNSEEVEQAQRQQQVTLEEVDTAVIIQQETLGNETDPKTSAQLTEPNQVPSEDKDIPVFHQLEIITKENHSEMAVEDIQETKDVPVSHQELKLADPGFEVPLELGGKNLVDSAVGCINDSDNDSEATDVYSFTENNSTHGTDIDLGTKKTSPDLVQEHSVTEEQVQSTDIDKFVTMTTDTNITVPDCESDEEEQELQTASVESTVSDRGQEKMTEGSQVEGSSQEATESGPGDAREEISAMFEDSTTSRGTSPLAVPDATEDAELIQVSPMSHTGLREGDKESVKTSPCTCPDISQTQEFSIAEEAPAQQSIDIIGENKTPSLTVSMQADIVLGEPPTDSTLIGEASSPEVTDSSQHEERTQEEFLQTLRRRRPNGVQISDSGKKLTCPMPEQVNIPKKRGPGRPRKIQTLSLPAKDNMEEQACPMLEQVNMLKKMSQGRPRKRRKVQRLPEKDNTTEVSCPMLQPPVIPLKRGPGRPRKVGLPTKERPVLPAKDYPIRSRVMKIGRGRPRNYPRPEEHSHVPGTNKNNIPHINKQLETSSRKRTLQAGEDLHNEYPPAKRRRRRLRQADMKKGRPRVEVNQTTLSVQQSSEEMMSLDSPDPGTLPPVTGVNSEEKQGHDSLCEEGNKETPILAHGKGHRLAKKGKERQRDGTCHLIQRRRGRPPKDMGKVASTSTEKEGQKKFDPLQVVPMKYTLSVSLTHINHQEGGHFSTADYANKKNKAWNDVSEKKRKARELVARSLRLRNHRKTSEKKDADSRSILRLQSLRQSAGRQEVTAPVQKDTPKKKGKSPLKCRYSMALLACSQCDFATIEEKKMEQHHEKTGHMATSSASLGEMEQEQEKPKTNGRMYKCRNCSYKNKKKAKVLRHKARCDKNFVRVLRPVKQSSKEEDIQSSNDVKKSSQSGYDYSKMYACNLCPFKTLRKNCLTTHKDHHNTRCKQRQRTCKLCSYGCNDKAQFRKHLKWHKEDKADSVEPVVSGTVEQTNVIEKEKSASTGNGEDHASSCNNMSDGDDEDDVKLKCPNCPFETHIPLSIELHIQHHKDICPHNHLQCRFCTFVCRTKTHMTRHMKVHKVATEPLREENHIINNSGDVEKQAFHAYDFDLNQENCPEKISVHTTVTKQTEAKEQHVCVKCSVVFRSRYRLLIHKIQHETGAYLRCEECKFRTKKHKKYQFLAHLNAHFNMKPYKCKYCPYRARCYSTVFHHILKSHNTKMQHSRYRCNKCSFSCKGLGWLKRHQELHLQGQVVPSEGDREAKYDIELENIIVCGKYKQAKTEGQDEVIPTTDRVSSTTAGSPQKHAGISCVREIQNTTDGSVELWFLCRFCGKMHIDQETWFAHVQRHIISSAWHPKNALLSKPAPREEINPSGCPCDGLCQGEEAEEDSQQHAVMEKHGDTDRQSDGALDTAEEFHYANIQGKVDVAASQKCGDGKEWSREISIKEDLEETANCSPSSKWDEEEEDSSMTGDRMLRNRLNSTDSVLCRQNSNPSGPMSTVDTDDDSDLPPLLKTTNELELAFVFPPEKQAELIREHLVNHETASIGSEDNAVPSLQEIKPEGHEETTYLPQCDNDSSVSCSGSTVGSSEGQLLSTGNPTSDEKEQEDGPDLSAWISSLQYSQTSEIEGAICTKVPGLPPGKTIRCQFCGQQFAFQLKFLQHAKRHLL
ncbi:uncharacterized protein LOC144910350 [Branchiostoma floridae x Branchiostoma belcheri]